MERFSEPRGAVVFVSFISRGFNCFAVFGWQTGVECGLTFLTFCGRFERWHSANRRSSFVLMAGDYFFVRLNGKASVVKPDDQAREYIATTCGYMADSDTFLTRW